MSGVSLNVQVQGDAYLRGLLARVTGPKAQRSLNAAMGIRVREGIRDHLAELAESRHTTAERLGASPSGHLEQAARAVEGAPIESTASAATITINHPGLGRALHDVTIVPTGGRKALTIPVAAIAYNRRAGQFDHLFVFKSKVTGNAFLAMRQPEKSTPPLLLYLLVRSVTQKQDRTLLPSDEQLQSDAIAGAHDWFEAQMGGPAA